MNIWTPDPGRIEVPSERLEVRGEVWRRIFAPDGKPETDWDKFPNGAATVGLNSMLDVTFRAQTQITAWYMGLIDDTGYTGVLAADTMSSHSGWTELTTYVSATRPAWAPGAAAAGSVTIASAISFVTSATSVIRGIFISSIATKSTTTGTLWATAVEASGRSIASGSTYAVFYTVTLVPAS